MLQGVFPAMPTPFHKSGELDLSRIQPLCHGLHEQGVDGVFLCGTTGEGPSLNAHEKSLIFEETLQAMQGKGLVIAQTTSYNMKETLQAIESAAQLGVDANSVMLPWFYKLDQHEQYLFMKQAAHASGDTPLYLYNIPQFTGNKIDLTVMHQLQTECPTIRGVKESSTDEPFSLWQDFISERFQVICGVDEAVRHFFIHGGKALVASTANVQPRAFRQLVDAALHEDWDQAVIHQRQIKRFLPLINEQNTIAVIKETLRLQGIDAGYVRPPLRNLEADEINQLKEELKNIEMLS